MMKCAEDQLSEMLNTNYLPKLNLSDDEINHANNIVKSISNRKPAIWLQTETSSPNKNWPRQYWDKLLHEKAKQYAFIDLSSQKYESRISVAITKVCKAGITLDSFLLHGSQAVNAQNTIVILKFQTKSRDLPGSNTNL